MRFVNIFIAMCLAFLTFTGVTVAFAAGETTAQAAETPMVDMLRPILDAARGGQGMLAACLTLVLAVALAKRYGAARFPVLHTDIGGAALTLLGSFGGALATTLMAGAAPSLGLAASALGVAFAAAGGYSMAKRLLVPTLRALQAKLPASMRPLLGLVLWVFDKPSPVAKAEAAGAAAVAAHPAPGIEGVAGKPVSFP